jgi:putative PIN family toxin of toxin-antitoxin system
MRVVLDTNVIVRAIRTPAGASAMLIVEALRGRVTPLVSTALGLEYEAVAMRREHWLQPGFGRVEAERLLDALAAVAEPVEISFRWRGSLSDANDDMVLETALNGAASALVTFNRRHFEAATAQFGLALRTPADILAELSKAHD